VSHTFSRTMASTDDNVRSVFWLSVCCLSQVVTCMV